MCGGNNLACVERALMTSVRYQMQCSPFQTNIRGERSGLTNTWRQPIGRLSHVAPMGRTKRPPLFGYALENEPKRDDTHSHLHHAEGHS